jgi:hypothetical protein
MKTLIAAAVVGATLIAVTAPVRAQALIGWTNGSSTTVETPRR